MSRSSLGNGLVPRRVCLSGSVGDGESAAGESGNGKGCGDGDPRRDVGVEGNTPQLRCRLRGIE